MTSAPLAFAPAIGSPVSFMRAVPGTRAGVPHELVHGEGIVVAVMLNPDLRPMVQVRSGGQNVNVDLVMVNPSLEHQEAYSRMLERVDALVQEGNRVIRDVQIDYQARVQAAYTDVLGEPVSIPAIYEVTHDTGESIHDSAPAQDASRTDAATLDDEATGPEHNA